MFPLQGRVRISPLLNVLLLNSRHRHVASSRLASQLQTLSARHPRTKFVSIVGDKCIPNYPDHLLPTMITYRKGEMVGRIVSYGVDKELPLEGQSFATRP